MFKSDGWIILKLTVHNYYPPLKQYLSHLSSFSVCHEVCPVVSQLYVELGTNQRWLRVCTVFGKQSALYRVNDGTCVRG